MDNQVAAGFIGNQATVLNGSGNRFAVVAFSSLVINSIEQKDPPFTFFGRAKLIIGGPEIPLQDDQNNRDKE